MATEHRRLTPPGLTVRWRFVVATLGVAGLSLAGVFGLLRSTSITTVAPASAKLVTVDYRLRNLALGRDGHVVGSRGKDLYRIVGENDAIEHLHRFDSVIQGVHVMRSGRLVVAVDDHPWSSESPSTIYLLDPDGESRRIIKRLGDATAMWWSMSSDDDGVLYVGEYGPRNAGMSNRVWRTTDLGVSWEIVFSAPQLDGVHIHRVAVDPYTQDVWVTVGDGREHRGAYRSRDTGARFEHILDSQATAIAFTRDAIYFGEDHRKQGRITRLDRANGRIVEVLRASRHGQYGGSIYDMTVADEQTVYAPTMKYSQQEHTATLWRGHDDSWELIAELPIGLKGAVNAETIAGPDRDGWIHMTGYKLRHVATPP